MINRISMPGQKRNDENQTKKTEIGTSVSKFFSNQDVLQSNFVPFLTNTEKNLLRLLNQAIKERMDFFYTPYRIGFEKIGSFLSAYVTHVSLAGDNNELIFLLNVPENACCVFDAKTGKIKYTHKPNIHSGRLIENKVKPEGPFAAISLKCQLNREEKTKIFALQKGELFPLDTQDQKITAMCFSPLNQQLFVCLEDNSIHSFDPAMKNFKKPLESPAIFLGHNDAVVLIKVSQEGWIITASKDKTIRVWDPATQQCVFCFQLKNIAKKIECTRDHLLVCTQQETDIHVFNFKQGDYLGAFQGHENEPFLGKSTLQNVIVSFSKESIQAWDCVTKECHWKINHTDSISELFLFENGLMASVVWSDQMFKIKIRDLEQNGDACGPEIPGVHFHLLENGAFVQREEMGKNNWRIFVPKKVSYTGSEEEKKKTCSIS